MRRGWLSFSFRSALGAAALLALTVGVARELPPATEISAGDLPIEAQHTLRQIKQGGPFPFRRDGSVFRNREGRLPMQPNGYYTEYTARTPGTRDRGGRRIVAGRGATGNVQTSGEYWYTNDHYGSFRRIRE